MDLLEYQGKQLLAAAGVPASSGTVATTVDEVVAAADAHGYPAVVKAQVRIGGRGKAGGIKVVADPAAAAAAAGAIMGMDIRSSRRATSPPSTTPASPSTGRPACTWACCRPRAASTSRRWRPATRRPWPASTSTPSTG